MLRAVSIAVILLAAPQLALPQPAFDPKALSDGQNVRLDEAVVRAKAGILLRVEIDHLQVYVAPIDPSASEFIAVGARVTVSGTLRRPPAEQQARLVYAMGPSEAHRLARTPFYVVAWSVSALD